MTARTIVVAQARSGSTRLPGKVLMKLSGVPVLQHVLSRASSIRQIDGVCLATTTRPEDEPIAAFAQEFGVSVCRGSEADVLSRYADAAAMMRADIVLRITCDCPLVDPAVCDQLITLRSARDAGYASNVPEGGRTWPHGLDCEIFTTQWLMTAHKTATAAYDREHVTPWLRRHAEPRAELAGPGGDIARQRWTLDYPEDFEFLTRVFERIGGGAFGWQDVLKVVSADPALSAINMTRRVT